MLTFWKTLASHLQDGQHVFLAFVAAHGEHSPGTAGAKLLVPERGEPLGSVGGGIMEYDLIQRARTVLAGGAAFAPEVEALDHHAKGNPSGLVCAGSQTNLYFLCSPEREQATVVQVAALVEADRSGWLTIRPSGMAVAEKAPDLVRPAVGLTEAQGSWIYEEQLLNRKRIAILGGGHCSLALSRMMRWLGFAVLVFDTRREIRSFENNPYARTVRLDDYREAAAHIPFPRLTNVVLMTNDFGADVQGLLGVLPLPVPYVGLMGSHAKIGRVFSALRKEGVAKAALARVVAGRQSGLRLALDQALIGGYGVGEIYGHEPDSLWARDALAGLPFWRETGRPSGGRIAGQRRSSIVCCNMLRADWITLRLAS